MLPKKSRAGFACFEIPAGLQRLVPGALLAIGGGHYHGDVVGFGGVIVDHGGGLGAEVAGFRVEIQRADAVLTLRAGELHTALDPLDSVGFHCMNSSPFASGSGHSDGRAAKVTRSRIEICREHRQPPSFSTPSSQHRACRGPRCARLGPFDFAQGRLRGRPSLRSDWTGEDALGTAGRMPALLLQAVVFLQDLLQAVVR